MSDTTPTPVGPGAISGEAWRVTILYSALTALLAYPLTLHPASMLMMDAPDTHLFMWTLGWDAHAFLHQPLSIFDANIYFPQRLTLAYSENLIGSALIAAPVFWLGGTPVLALNIVVLLSPVLCGLGAYLLARRVGLDPIGATLCGLVFAFSPARFFRVTQLHLATVQWIPFTLAYLHAYLDRGRARDLRIAAGFFSLQAITSGHGASFATLAVMLLLGYRVILGEPVAIVRRVRDLGIAGAALLAPAVLIYLPYRAVQSELGLARSLEDWTPRPESYLASPTTLHTWLLSWLPGPPINDTANAFLFPGYLPVLLVAVALWWPTARSDQRAAPATQTGNVVLGWVASHRRDRWRFYGLLAFVCVWLSAGTPLHLWSWVNGLPGLSLIRVPSRFMILAMLGIAVLAGRGFERLALCVTPRNRRLGAAAVGLLMVVEFAGIPLQLAQFQVPTPAAERWLSQQPTPFVVAEIPVGTKARFQTTYMLHSMVHWQKTIHGYSGVQAPLHDELFERLKSFPDEASLGRLEELGVSYVVIHPDLFTRRDWADVEARLPKFSERLPLVHEEDGGLVYSLPHTRAAH